MSVAIIRGWIGQAEPPTDAEIEQLLSDLTYPREVVLSVLRGRLAEATADASDFSIDGDYRESNSARINALREAIREASKQPLDLRPTIDDGRVGDGSFGQMVRAGNQR